MSASRYETLLKLASGGMATVWIGNARGALGFRQLVAIKKPHPHLLSDPAFRSELVAEARLASMIHHANVVDVRDVEIEGESISLVMDYIEGASLGELLVAANRKGTRISARVAVRIVLDACAGLHAAHELVDERDRPVGLVHRDVSPQNVLVGADGISRVADFGVAKFARKNMQSTSEGSLKGKLAYMAPEYVRGEAIDRRFDVFALGIVLWESLAGRRCFRGDNEAETLRRLLEHVPEPVSTIAPELAAIDAVVACALAKNRDDRFSNAAAMAAALEASALSAGLLGGHGEVAKAVKELVGPAIDERRALVRAKQANEPSVASLMGVPPIVALPEPVPATLVDVVPTMTSPAATPKMGSGGAMTLPATSAVPTTKPMTPHMAPRANVTAPVPIPNTVMSPGPPVAMPPPAITNSTLRSDASPVADAVEPQLAFHDPSRRAIDPIDIPGVSSSSALKWIVSAVVGVSILAIIGGVAFVATRPPPSVPANDPAPTPSITASPVPASASATASVATTIPSAAAPTPTTTATHAARPPTTAHTTTVAPVPPPPPAPTPTETATASAKRAPPPNPYGAGINTR